MKSPWFERATDALIEHALLPEFPAVMVTGPRGCGKSSSMNRFADTTLDLAKPGPRAAVEDDPDGVLAAAIGVRFWWMSGKNPRRSSVQSNEQSTLM